MLELNFNIPEQFHSPENTGFRTDSAAINNWLNDLPLANLDISAEEFLQKQRTFNITSMSVEDRVKILGLLQPRVDDITEALRNKYITARLPLTTRYLRLLALSLNVNNEAMIGYRIIAHMIGRKESIPDNAHEMLMHSLIMCMHHLSQILVCNYSVYFPMPPYLWNAIHQIYYFSEQRGAQDTSLFLPDSDKPTTIALEYKRMILLALSNPYHLMQDEVIQVYEDLEELVVHCDIHKPDEHDSDGYFLIDLMADAAPRYLHKASTQHGIDTRILDISRLLNKIAAIVSDLEKPPATKETLGISRLKRRMKLDMYRRLHNSWGRNSERMHERHAMLGKLAISIGLSTTHHFASGEESFTPELDEIHINFGEVEPSEGLSLVPLELETWKIEDDEDRILAGVMKPRSSDFDNDSIAKDVWQKIFLNKDRIDVEEDTDFTFFTSSEWSKKNVSLGGLCLFCAGQHCTSARVGELVGHKDPNSDLWIVGTIRWLHVLNNTKLELGIMNRYNHIRPVAVRAIAGTGKGGDYFRALLTVDQPLDHEDSRLITPAAIYDVDTKLVLNLGEKIKYIMLTSIKFSTKSFTEFRFVQVDQPESETRKLEEMNNML